MKKQFAIRLEENMIKDLKKYAIDHNTTAQSLIEEFVERLIKRIVIVNGKEVSMDYAAEMMDDDIREELHSKIAPCGEQEFIDAYVLRHYEKFDEPFQVE